MSKLSVTGTDKLIKRLKEGADLKGVQETVKRHGAEMQQKAMRSAPVDTGTLKRSISLEIANRGYTAEVKPTVHYATYVEYGTRFNPAQPFIRPNFQSQQDLFISDIQKLLK